MSPVYNVTDNIMEQLEQVECTSQDSDNIATTSSMREVLRYFLNSPLQVSKIELPNEGDAYNGRIRFYVPLTTRITNGYLDAHYNDIFNNFFADCLAELMVRENMGMFVDAISKIGVRSYAQAVDGQTHRHFGVRREKTSIVFTFHISLLQQILMADFRKTV